MPLPITNKKFNHIDDISFTYDSLKKRPELASKIMMVISIWSYIEVNFETIATYCLNSDFETVAVMLGSIKNPDAKRQAISMAVLHSHPSDYNLFLAVEKCIKSSRNRRNDFAHHLLGVSDELPDSLIVMNPKKVPKNFARDYAATKRKTLSSRSGFESKDVMVYSENDLNDDIENAEKALYLVSLMMVVISGTEEAEKARNGLLSLPVIDAALNQYQKNTP